MEYGKTTQKKDAKRDCLPSGQSLFIICLLFIFRLSSFSRLFIFRLSSFSRLFIFRLSFFFQLICLSPLLLFPLICLSPLLLFRLFIFRFPFFSCLFSSQLSPPKAIPFPLFPRRLPPFGPTATGTLPRLWNGYPL